MIAFADVSTLTQASLFDGIKCEVISLHKVDKEDELDRGEPVGDDFTDDLRAQFMKVALLVNKCETQEQMDGILRNPGIIHMLEVDRDTGGIN